MDRATLDILKACVAQITYADEARCFKHCADPKVATKLLKRLERIISSATLAEGVVTTRTFVSSANLPPAARDVFHQFAVAIMHPRGANWVWVIGDANGLHTQYIKPALVAILDGILLSVGFRDGEGVDILYTY